MHSKCYKYGRITYYFVIVVTAYYSLKRETRKRTFNVFFKSKTSFQKIPIEIVTSLSKCKMHKIRTFDEKGWNF